MPDGSFLTDLFFRSELEEVDGTVEPQLGQIPSPLSSESNPDLDSSLPDTFELTSKHDNSSNLVDLLSKLSTHASITTATTFPEEITSVNMTNETTTTVPPPPPPVQGAQEEIKEEIQPETRQGPVPRAEMGFQKDLWQRIKR